MQLRLGKGTKTHTHLLQQRTYSGWQVLLQNICPYVCQWAFILESLFAFDLLAPGRFFVCLISRKLTLHFGKHCAGHHHCCCHGSSYYDEIPVIINSWSCFDLGVTKEKWHYLRHFHHTVFPPYATLGHSWKRCRAAGHPPLHWTYEMYQCCTFPAVLHWQKLCILNFILMLLPSWL